MDGSRPGGVGLYTVEDDCSGTITFEGEPHGSGVSFFLVHSEPGAGPGLHRHPYSETWIVRGGLALFPADGEELDPDELEAHFTEVEMLVSEVADGG